MTVTLKRADDAPSPADGCRALVDRLWPRGVSKADARLDVWLRDEAPGDALRRRFHADRSRWSEFRRRRLAELKDHREALRPLAQRAVGGRVTLLTAASEPERSHDEALRQYLGMLGAETR